MRTSKFSVATLLLTSTLIAVCLYAVTLNSDLKRTKRELRSTTRALNAARATLGTLSIEDPLLPAALSIPSLVETEWRWRFYLPSNRPYALRYAIGDIPDSGQPASGHTFDSFLTTAKGNDGYFDLTVRLRQNTDGLWAIHAECVGHNTLSMGIDPAPDWLGKSFPGSHLIVAGKSRTQAAFEDGTLLLLHWHHPRLPHIPESPGGGLAVWVEPL